MKKSFILAFALSVGAATVSFAQSTTSSTPPGGNHGTQAKQGNTQPNPTAPASVGSAQPNDSTSGNAGPTSPKSNANEGSSRPGGEDHKNANDVGKYSGNDDSKSMLNSKEARAQRQKNLTESDTTLKSGSGSAPKNMKNNTGKTGNYQNQEIKHNQKTSPRP